MYILFIFIALVVGLPLFAVMLFPFFLLFSLPAMAVIGRISRLSQNIESAQSKNLSGGSNIEFNFMAREYYKLNPIPATALFSRRSLIFAPLLRRPEVYLYIASKFFLVIGKRTRPQ